MNKRNPDTTPPSDTEVVSPATDEAQRPFLAEFRDFLIHHPVWWLAPIVIMVVLFGLAIALLPTEALPFIYTLW